jgi:hypothetical protein
MGDELYITGTSLTDYAVNDSALGPVIDSLPSPPKLDLQRVVIECTYNGTEVLLTIHSEESYDPGVENKFARTIESTQNLDGITVEFGLAMREIGLVADATSAQIDKKKINCSYSFFSDDHEKTVVSLRSIADLIYYGGGNVLATGIENNPKLLAKPKPESYWSLGLESTVEEALDSAGAETL